MLARSLAPVLYLQRDERFPLSRVVAVIHPAKRIIAYHLLWRDDVNGSWIPFTVATDQEIVWVGYDQSGAPTEVWTYWHGTILHTPWPQVAGRDQRAVGKARLAAARTRGEHAPESEDTELLLCRYPLSRAGHASVAGNERRAGEFPYGYNAIGISRRKCRSCDRLDAIVETGGSGRSTASGFREVLEETALATRHLSVRSRRRCLLRRRFQFPDAFRRRRILGHMPDLAERFAVRSRLRASP